MIVLSFLFCAEKFTVEFSAVRFILCGKYEFSMDFVAFRKFGKNVEMNGEVER